MSALAYNRFTSGMRATRCGAYRLHHILTISRSSRRRSVSLMRVRIGVDEMAEKESFNPSKATEKYGLEYGLFKVFARNPEGSKAAKSKGQQAKDLLAKYGSAYLITSITFAIISFTICYALVSIGADVPGLLARIGLEVGEGGEQVGTVAIAYAAHKALSPVRFPPTVALTPVVARLLGREPPTQPAEEAAASSEQQKQP